MSDQLVHTELADSSAIIEIRRPAKKNAIDSTTASTLVEAVAGVVADPNVCVVVLCGQGGDLSAGADVDEPVSTEVDWRDTAHARLLRTVRSSAVPVVAAVDGWAMGLGTALVGACTFAVAGQSAQFGLPEAKLGFFPLGAVPNLIRRTRPDVVLRWALTGQRISAAVAAQHALVTDVVPAGAARRGALELASELAGPGRSVVTHGMTWMRQWSHHSMTPLDEWCESQVDISALA